MASSRSRPCVSEMTPMTRMPHGSWLPKKVGVDEVGSYSPDHECGRVEVTCSQCRGIELQFDEKAARRDLGRYRRRGPVGTTRKLIRMLAEDGVVGRAFLDIGGGVGA